MLCYATATVAMLPGVACYAMLATSNKVLVCLCVVHVIALSEQYAMLI